MSLAFCLKVFAIAIAVFLPQAMAQSDHAVNLRGLERFCLMVNVQANESVASDVGDLRAVVERRMLEDALLFNFPMAERCAGVGMVVSLDTMILGNGYTTHLYVSDNSYPGNPYRLFPNHEYLVLYRDLGLTTYRNSGFDSEIRSSLLDDVEEMFRTLVLEWRTQN